ncbi:MAG: radical SAM protein [Candidatus Omnitrophica bacterium]|nr:radical SAM protein [Candidatus Omnitrophota bacterium]MDD5552715.1 radical SAM protein [Candidatus Omnitrophota bacterium]
MWPLIAKLKNKIEEYNRISEKENTDSRTIQNGELKIIFDNQKRARLYFKENELTKHCGLSTEILSEGARHYSSDSEFEVNKISEQELRINVKSPTLPADQIWRIKITGEGSIIWDVDMELKEPLRIDLKSAKIFLSKSYSRWVIPQRTDAFSPEFGPCWQPVNLPKEAVDFIGCASLKDDFPDIILKECQDTKASLLISNTDANLSSRVMEVQFEEGKELYRPGPYPYLRSVIQFYGDKAILQDILEKIRQAEEEERKLQLELKEKEEALLRKAQEEAREEERKLQLELKEKEEALLRKARDEDEKRRNLDNGPFRLYFDHQNQMHIYYKNNESTKGSGLNFGILCESNWYSSVDSHAQIEKPSSHEMVVRLTHNRLPLIQTWHLELNAEGKLTWDVDVEIKQPLRIDRRNAALFLSKAYKEWVAPPKQEHFSPGFNSGWQCMNSAADNPEFIGVISSSDNLPDITLKNLQDTKASLLISNTDANLSSRVVEVQFEEEKELYRPGTYPYLKAVIQLYADKAVLEVALNKIRQAEEEERRRQIEQRKKYIEERKRLEELRVKQEQEQLRKAQEEEMRRKEREAEEEKRRKEKEAKENAFSIFKEDIKRITPKEERSEYIFGDRPELHDKISSEDGDFERIISRIRSARKESINLKIGISRLNFFKLNTIAQFCSGLINRRQDLRSISLKLFPVKNLYSNFREYVKELNERLSSSKVNLFLKDEELLDLLWNVSLQADQYNEKELLRLLGIISEHPFIGPQTIVIDTNHRCNTNCLHCWIHTPLRKIPPRSINIKMDFQLYKNIVDDAVSLLSDEIIFQGDGEPLLDERFFEMAGYARDKGMKVLFFTNGILMDKEKARRIMDLEINEIFCSLPAGTDKTYALINPKQSKDTFPLIVENLKGLISLRKASGRDKPILQMSHVIHNLNYQEMEEMAKADAYIGADKVRFYLVRLDENIKSLKLSRSHVEAMSESLKKVAPYLKKENIELQDNIYFQLKNYDPSSGSWAGKTFLKTGCPVGWFFCLALARGELSMCCHLRTLGSLDGKNFAQLWDSESYNKIRTQAKYLMENKDVTFGNGRKLYDEFCSHCDTHQVILMINGLLEKYKLNKFLDKASL